MKNSHTIISVVHREEFMSESEGVDSLLLPYNGWSDLC